MSTAVLDLGFGLGALSLANLLGRRVGLNGAGGGDGQELPPSSPSDHKASRSPVHIPHTISGSKACDPHRAGP